MSRLVIGVQPADGEIGLREKLKDSRFTLNAEFMREIAVEDREVVVVRDTARSELIDGFGRLEIDDLSLKFQVAVSILSDRGTPKASYEIDPSKEPALITLTKAAVEALLESEDRPPEEPESVRRDGVFVAVGETAIDFATTKLELASLQDPEWASTGLDRLFSSQVPIAASTEVAGPWPGYSLLSWSATHVAVDGQFSGRFDAKSGVAWVWLLSGTISLMGVVVDGLAPDTHRRTVIPLPPISGGGPPVPMRRPVPPDVTESEVAENPDIYMEDPGAYCRPFSNPERVLGERRFSVIHRVEQPSIGVQPSIVGTGFTLLAATPVSARPSGGVFRRFFERGRVGDRDDESDGGVIESVPRLVASKLPIEYLDPLRRSDRVRGLIGGSNPVLWEGDASRYQATSVARGHILEFTMRTLSNGYSLGTVAKSLTLAPRQVRRVQKVEWQRRERVERTERTQVTERVEDEVSRERDYEDAVQSNLSEWAHGSSSSSVSAFAGGFGFALPGFVIGGGGGHSNASSESSQTGGRRVTASEEQRLRDTTHRYAESLRRLESTVVTEVTQEEEVVGTTEVIRNYNYAHSLTVIYHQILRHLKVETAFSGVRECLFVPFAITPFTIARALRWREFIRKGLRESRFAPALGWLGDAATGFAESNIPAGRRSDQAIRHIHGSIFVALAVARPKDDDEDEFLEDAWYPLLPFLAVPARAIQAQMRALLSSIRDREFQREHAPGIASAWVDTLQLFMGGQPVAADFTLATRYSYNGRVRVDFTVPVSTNQNITRETMSSIVIRASRRLTPGSVANVSGMSWEYQTDFYRRTGSISQGLNDLINPETGVQEPSGAVLSSPPDPWERRDERAEILKAVNELVTHLNEHAEYYHKCIWWGMDRDRLFMLLDGFKLPSNPLVSVASVVERDPIAIIGNSLVFRVSAGSFLGLDDLNTPQKLHSYYATQDPPRSPLHISLPTDGLYAQTIMDECDALEDHFGNQDWALSDRDPELGAVDPSLLTTRRAEPIPTEPSAFPQSIINLQNAPEAPAPSGLAAVLNAATTADAFRDMAGLAGTQANARAGLETAAQLATSFGNQAAALRLAEMAAKADATRAADQKLASIKKAADQQLVNSDDAAQHANQVLGDLHSPSASTPPHEGADVARFIRTAAVTPGSEVEATTADGAVKVTLASRQPTPLAQNCGFPTLAGRPVSESAVRTAVQDAAIAEEQLWRSGGVIVGEGAVTQFGHLVRYWLNEDQAIPMGNLLVLAQNAVNPNTNYRQLLSAAGTAQASIDNDARVVAQDLMVGVPLVGVPPNLEQRIIRALGFARQNRLDTLAWSGCFVNSCIRAVEMNLNFEGVNGGGSEALLALSPRGRHWEYARAADVRRKGLRGPTGSYDPAHKRDGTYHAFDPSERPPSIGDIIVLDRQAATAANALRLRSIQLPAGQRETHGDIVVDVQQGYVETIGGNLGQGANGSVRRRRYPRAANGNLVVDPAQEYVNANAQGTFVNLPLPHPAAAGTFNGSNTARIFALLSPVEACPVFPGIASGDPGLTA